MLHLCLYLLKPLIISGELWCSHPVNGIVIDTLAGYGALECVQATRKRCQLSQYICHPVYPYALTNSSSFGLYSLSIDILDTQASTESGNARIDTGIVFNTIASYVSFEYVQAGRQRCHLLH